MSAKQGNVTAQNNLGMYYYEIEKDYVQAVRYFRLSAREYYKTDGDAMALRNLCVCYFRGYGVAQDYKKAFKYCRLSVEKKCFRAYANLGRLYYYGEGVDINYKKALELYILSDNADMISKCESKLLETFNMSNVEEYVFMHPLYVKHKYKGLDKLTEFLKHKYLQVVKILIPDLNNIIISYLL